MNWLVILKIAYVAGGLLLEYVHYYYWLNYRILQETL